MAELGTANIGGRAVPAWVLESTAEEIDNGTKSIESFSRPNLLDNWYFRRPVNQRGQTEYSTNWNQYTIDRWSTEGTAGEIKVVVSTGCVDVTNMLSQSTDHAIQFKQVLPTEISLPGKTYTLSILTKNVVGSVSGYLAQNGAPYSASFEFPITSGLSTYTGVMIDGQQRVGFVLAPGASMSLIAAKLELGPTQTLAHQENGVWVLNEVPEYGEQLRRCQRYYYQVHYVQYQTINAAYEDIAYAFLMLPLPVEMRLKNPVVTQSAPIALGTGEKTLVGAEVCGCLARLAVNYDAMSNPAKACYTYCPSAGGVTFTLSADL